MLLSNISSHLNNDNIKISNKDNLDIDIKNVRHFEKNINYDDKTLYIANDSQVNYLSLSELPLNTLIANESIDISSLLNKVLDYLSQEEKLAKDSLILINALSSGKGVQHIIDVSSELLNNPLFIRDTNFNIIGYTKNVIVDDEIWNDLTKKGYQDYEGFQYLMKNGFIERINKSEHPIYYKVTTKKDIDFENVQTIPISIFPEYKYSLHNKYDEDVKISRVWCKITDKQKILAHLVVLEAFNNFTEYDILLMQKISEIIALELQKNLTIESEINLKHDVILVDLIHGKIKDQEELNEKLKILDLKFKKYFKMIILKTGQNKNDGMPFNYVKGFFEHVLGNIVSTLYNGSYIAIYDSKTEKTLNESQLNLLKTFAKDTGMLCGISRNFENLLMTSKHYRQCIEAISNGIRLSPENVLFLYEDYILQDMFNICSSNDSLKDFCNPALLELLDFDKENNTDFVNTLHSYVLNFKNPSDLANELNIHRNTLYYRLSKIEEITKIDLEPIENLFSLYLSFKILEYLGLL